MGPAVPSTPGRPALEGKCSKKYPKPFAKHTMMDHDGHCHLLSPLQEEKDDRTVTFVRNGVVFHVTNAAIVLYCPFLRMKFEAHINRGKSNSMQNIKYLHMYCHQVDFV